MKVHLVQSQILLLQTVGQAQDFIRQQGTQVASFTADRQSHFVGVYLGSDFNGAERGRGEANAHFRLSGAIDHLGHLYWAHGGRTVA